MTTLSMQSSPAMPHPAWPSLDVSLPRRTLGILTLLVILAHWALLGGLPSLLPNWESDGRLAGGPSTDVFVTRTIALPVVEAKPQTPPAPAEPQIQVQQAPPAAAAPAFEAIAPPPQPALAALAPLMPLTPLGEGGDEAYGVAGLTDDGTPLTLVLPNPARLKYDVKGESKGIPYSASGELLWNHDGKNYDARLQVSFLLLSRSQSSKGALTVQGLEPLRFGDKGTGRSEVAAHFERDKNKVSFSANTPDVQLTTGAQDQLSVFMQLAALFGGNPTRMTQGVVLSFQAIGPRSAENWIFKVGGTETLKLPGGEVTTIKLVRDSLGDNDAKGEIWLAPSLGYLPARIRLTQGGDVVDQLWRSTQIP